MFYPTGGSPYPGVSVQELISLLEGAYRMPKPNHVSEKLWVKCFVIVGAIPQFNILSLKMLKSHSTTSV